MPRANREIADLCLEHAWNENIDDRSRWLLELAAKRINRLGRRCVSLSHHLEAAEGDIGELLHEIQEMQNCRYRMSWQTRLASWLYGGLVFVFVILRDISAVVHTQLKMLADNCAYFIRTLIT